LTEIDLSQGLAGYLDDLKENVANQPRGARDEFVLLEVLIHGCENLKKADLFGSSDPYCKFNWHEIEDGHDVAPHHSRTRTIDNNLNPVFDEYFHFLIPHNLKDFRIDIYDYDVGSMDDKIGFSSVTVQDMCEFHHSKYAVEKKGKIELTHIRVPIAPLFGDV